MTDQPEKPRVPGDHSPVKTGAANATFSSGEKVTVACKVPNGIQMQLSAPVDTPCATPGGGHHIEKISRKFGPIVVLNGPGLAVDQRPSFDMIGVGPGQVALTHGVDRDFFDAWMKENADSDIVRNRLVFAHRNMDYLRDKQKDEQKLVSGLEPIIPGTDWRLPRSPKRGVSNIETAVMQESS